LRSILYMLNQPVVDEQTCIENALQNPDAYECIVKTYEHRLLRYVQRISSVNTQDAEDIIQDVFIKAFVHLNSFEHGKSFRAWLYSIAHHEVVSFWRKHKNRLAVVQLDIDEVDRLVSEYSSGSDQYDTKQMNAQVNAIMHDLPLKYSEVLELFYIEGYGYEEISDILKKPTSTVGTLLRRAKQQFKNQLLKTYGKHF